MFITQNLNSTIDHRSRAVKTGRSGVRLFCSFFSNFITLHYHHHQEQGRGRGGWHSLVARGPFGAVSAAAKIWGDKVALGWTLPPSLYSRHLPWKLIFPTRVNLLELNFTHILKASLYLDWWFFFRFVLWWPDTDQRPYIGSDKSACGPRPIRYKRHWDPGSIHGIIVSILIQTWYAIYLDHLQRFCPYWR